MQEQLNRIERRFGKRLDISLPITLFDHKVKSKNVSPGGIYFEVVTDDIEKYSPGKPTKVEITASTSTHEISDQIVKLTGIGVVTRTDKLFSDQYGEKLGVALKFSEKLELTVKTANYYSRSKHSIVNPE
ncbi:MAG: PilZ domain-containing protein [Candidatus Scalindua sp.]